MAYGSDEEQVEALKKWWNENGSSMLMGVGVVLILLFVFYSSLIFYYGGCFIKAISDDLKLPIRPVKEAFRYQVQEIIPEEQP